MQLRVGPGLGRAVLGIGGAADHVLSEDNRDFSTFRTTFDRLESRLARISRMQASDVVLEAAHEEKQADDGKRPRDENDQQEDLIRSHARKCRRH